MSEPFIGEIRMWACTFAPRNWALCNGQSVAISQNETLYALISTTFGGNGVNNFLLPDMRGRAPVGPGDGYYMGFFGGAENVLLHSQQLPTHNHQFNAENDPGVAAAPGKSPLLAIASTDPLYASPDNLTGLISDSVPNVGGSQSHNNMQPSSVVNFCIALHGLFPPRN